MTVKKSVIIGYDAVSSLGTDLETQWRRAVQGESGIAGLTRSMANRGVGDMGVDSE